MDDSVSTSFVRSFVRASIRENPNVKEYTQKFSTREHAVRSDQIRSDQTIALSTVGKRAKKKTIGSALTIHPINQSFPSESSLVSRTRSLRDDVRAELLNTYKKKGLRRRQYFRHSKLQIVVGRVADAFIRRQIIYNRMSNNQSDREMRSIDRSMRRVSSSSSSSRESRVPSSRCDRPVDRRFQCQKSTPGSPCLRRGTRSFRLDASGKVSKRASCAGVFCFCGVYTWHGLYG